jgi:hypothetical protein
MNNCPLCKRDKTGNAVVVRITDRQNAEHLGSEVSFGICRECMKRMIQAGFRKEPANFDPALELPPIELGGPGTYIHATPREPDAER